MRHKNLSYKIFFWVLVISFLSITSCIHLPKSYVLPDKLLHKVKGATYEGSEACEDCHEDTYKSFKGSVHEKLVYKGKPEEGCEACHGPGSVHNEEADEDEPELSRKSIINREDIAHFIPEERTALCYQCHKLQRYNILESDHLRAGLTCIECHTPELHPISKKKEKEERENPKKWTWRRLNIREFVPKAERKIPTTTNQFCLQCHRDTEVTFRLQYHHPLTEGKINCADCHDPHGKQVSASLFDDKRERCFKCHIEKRGPFVWEHEAYDDGCLSCHTPHGSINDKLLTQRDNGLCIKCHFEVNFPNIGNINHRSLLDRGATCYDCHFEVHGSNTNRYFNPAF